MLIRPSASSPSAAPPMDLRFLLTILYAISAAPESTGSLASLNSQPMPVISYSAVSASMPITTSSPLDLITWIVSIASSNVMPAFFSAAYLGSAMSSNLFRGEKKTRRKKKHVQR